QFLILKPYQSQGHGSTLYRTLFNNLLVRDDVTEITVEDPNEAFQDLRDKCDLRLLMGKKVFDGVVAPVGGEVVREVRRRFKMSKRQVERCMEMVLLKNLNEKSVDAIKAFRLQVKGRVYRQNEEALAALDVATRKEKLAETYRNIEEEYYRLLQLV
ncbi:histone acetyltransferase 1, partial [Rhizophlyctis rosea]